jgi:hypothetical protein
MNEDLKQLDLLSKFHYIYAFLNILYLAFPLIFFFVGSMLLKYPNTSGVTVKETEALEMGLQMIIIASVFSIIYIALAICSFLAGKYLKKRKHWMFCIILSGFNCICVPFGLVLGVLTITILNRNSVQSLFAENRLA